MFYFNLTTFKSNDSKIHSTIENDLEFIKYTNVKCDVYSLKNQTYTFCLNINFDSFLIFQVYFQKFHLNISMYFMIDNKCFRCNEIIIKFVVFNKCVNIFFRFRNQFENYVIVRNEMHKIFDLFCNIILKMITQKSHQMKIK